MIMFCPKCRSEYVEGISVCDDCRMPLVAELPEKAEDEYEYEHFVSVKTYFTRSEADFDQSVLAGNGIESFVATGGRFQRRASLGATGAAWPCRLQSITAGPAPGGGRPGPARAGQPPGHGG